MGKPEKQLDFFPARIDPETGDVFDLVTGEKLGHVTDEAPLPDTSQPAGRGLEE